MRTGRYVVLSFRSVLMARVEDDDGLPFQTERANSAVVALIALQWLLFNEIAGRAHQRDER